MKGLPHVSRALSVIAGLIATGLILLFLTRAWDEQSTVRPGPIPDIAEPLNGNDIVPWAMPSSLVSGAAVLALLAVGPQLRRLILLLAGIASLGPLTGGILGAIDTPGIWPIATCLASMAMVAIVAAAWFSAPHWTEPTSRYKDHDSTDSATSLEDPSQIWKALDAGHDPTSSSISSKAAKEEKPR